VECLQALAQHREREERQQAGDRDADVARREHHELGWLPEQHQHLAHRPEHERRGNDQQHGEDQPTLNAESDALSVACSGGL
jgi:hypothetical protein